MSSYLIIDGYNVINSWPNLKQLSQVSLEDARKMLIDNMAEYQSFTGVQVIIVFDAYQVKSAKIKQEKVYGVDVVYTKENQTADSFIEIKVEELTRDKRNLVRVVTSDWAQQQVILGSGGVRITPRELLLELEHIKSKIGKRIEKDKPPTSLLGDRIDRDVLEYLEKWRKKGN